jgi:sugar lactone lactonase YvrE
MKTENFKRPWPAFARERCGRRLCAAVIAVSLLIAGNLKAMPVVQTVSGGPAYGYVDGNTKSNALFHTPIGLALGSDPAAGRILYVADRDNNAIRKLDLDLNQTITFLTGKINQPVGVALDGDGNLYVLNHGNGSNGTVLKFNRFGNFLGTNAAALINANGIALDGGTNIYVTVNGNAVIKISPGSFPGVKTNVATINIANTSLQGVAVTSSGYLAVCDSGNHGIWMINPTTGETNRLTGFAGAGDAFGVPGTARFNQPYGIAAAGGGMLVVTDYGNHRVKTVDSQGTVSSLYGVCSSDWNVVSGNPSVFPGWWDGNGCPSQITCQICDNYAEARLPVGVVVAPNGDVYTTEVYYHLIRQTTATGLTGSQPGNPLPSPSFNGPMGIALNSSGSLLFIVDQTNNAIQVLDFGNNSTTTFLNSGNGVSHPASVLVDPNNNIYVLNQNAGTNGSILEFDVFGNLLATNVTGLNQPTALTMDGNGNIFIAERAGGIIILFPNGATNTIVTITNANVSLQGIAIFDDGFLAVSDAGNHVIWTVNPITKIVTKLTGQLGVSGTTLGTSNLAMLYQPHQLARAGNNQLVIADYGNNRLVTATRSGSITNVLNSTNSLVWFGQNGDPFPGSSVQMLFPFGVAVSSSGLVYDSEPTNHAIRGLTTAIAAPLTAPIVTLPFFSGLQGIAFDGINNDLFIADFANNAVQLLDLNNNLTSTFLTMNDGILNPVSVLVDTNENIYVLNQGTPGNGFILEFDYYGNAYSPPIVTGLNQPTALTMDGNGNIFIAERAGGIIILFPNGATNTIVTITNANVSLQGIAIFDDGYLAVSDAGNHVIWTVNPITKLVTKLTGQLGVSGTAVGVSNFAKLYQPHQLARVGGNQIVAADYGNNRLVLVQRNGTVITNNPTYHLNSSVASIWFGQNGDPITSGNPKFVPMILPSGIALGDGGELFASETYYEDIRGLTGTGLTSPTSNPGVPLPVYSSPAGIALNNTSTLLFIADPTNNTISKLNLGNNQTTVFLDSSSGIYQPVDVALDSSDNLYVLNQGTGGNGSILKFDKYGNLLKTNVTSLALPTAMTLDSAGDIYVTEQSSNILVVFPSGISNLVATVTNAGVFLQGIALLDDGTITVSDTGNHVIWKINPVSKAVSLFTGQIGSSGKILGPPAFAKLNQPKRLARAAGNLLVAADSGNNQIVLITSDGSITSSLISTNGSIWFGVAGDPYSATYVPMVSPNGLAIGAAGAVFTSEDLYKDIREITGTGLSQLGIGGGGGGTGTNAVIIAPIISPNAGYFPMGQDILVTSPNPGVYYTTDGSEPTTNSAPVSITGNNGHIHWFNTTNDLTALRVKAFINGTNASATVSGQPVTTNTIGTPPDFNPMIQAGIGSSIVIPVVCNLGTNQQIKSYQLRYEIYPTNNANTPVMQPLSIFPTNDFIPVVTAIQNGALGTVNYSYYTHTLTNGIAFSTAITNGNNGNTSFKNYAVVVMLEVLIPYAANEGDTYALNVLYPSATSDGYNANVPLTPMPTTMIVVTNIPYVVGDSASPSGSWYNAGTFGDDNLDNSDVNQAFYASSGLRVPYSFSDVFNAMDVYPSDSPGFVGGDGQIRFLDWQTILNRSLRLDPNNWSRAWSAGGILVNNFTNIVVPHPLLTKVNPKVATAPWYRQVLMGVGSVGNVTPDAIVYVPVYAKLDDGSTLSGLQFRAVVTPQDYAPPLTAAPQLVMSGGTMSPYLTKSLKSDATAFGWSLGSFNFLSRSSNFLGWVTFTVPHTAVSGQSYLVSLANADGAPNVNTQYNFESRSATVTVNAPAPPASICSDEWKVCFFGSTTNPAAADNADPDGDGVPNWMEFLAGTDPTSPQSKLQIASGGLLTTKSQRQMQLNWLTAPGRAYELQSSSSLTGGWTTIATVSGDGTVSSLSDTNSAGTTRYYRLHILP